MKLTYDLTKESQWHLLTLSGDLIGDEVGPKLVEFVSDAVNDDIKNFIIDLSSIRYISSSGIGLLITMLTKMRNAGGEIYLCSPSEHVKKLLIITKLNNIFNVFDSLDQVKKELS